MTKIKGIIFDVDGTLVDTRATHINSWHEAFKKFGYKITTKELQEQFGKRSEETIAKFLPRNKQETEGRKIIVEKEKMFRANLSKVRTMPFVHELFDYLRIHKIKIALATSASKKELNHYINSFFKKDRIDEVISAEDVSTSKPNPEVFITVQKRLELQPNQILVIGDSPHDIIASKLAGFKCIGVLSGGHAKNALLKAGANAVFDDIKDIFTKLPDSLNIDCASSTLNRGSKQIS